MKCIICEDNADEVGSHLIPASLIKNCVGKHYREESYNIDSKTSKISVYYGRDNLKNTSTEIKQNDYKRDYLLCKKCEKKLADLESKFATEFLQKFRIEKFSNNFIQSYSIIGHEIYEPKKLTNEEILVYFYSIILRFCKVYHFESKDSYIEENEMLKIKNFINGYFYKKIDHKIEIEEYKLIINFNKYSDKSQFIATSNHLKNPYIFYFCDAILILFTESMDEKADILFGEISNKIVQKTTKIIVGPELLYNTLSSKIASLMANDYITNGVNYLCEINNKTYEANLLEVNELIEKYKGKDLYLTTGIFEELKKKYSS
jgi:hypothetical protein